MHLARQPRKLKLKRKFYLNRDVSKEKSEQIIRNSKSRAGKNLKMLISKTFKDKIQISQTSNKTSKE